MCVVGCCAIRQLSLSFGNVCILCVCVCRLEERESKSERECRMSLYSYPQSLLSGQDIQWTTSGKFERPHFIPFFAFYDKTLRRKRRRRRRYTDLVPSSWCIVFFISFSSHHWLSGPCQARQPKRHTAEKADEKRKTNIFDDARWNGFRLKIFAQQVFFLLLQLQFPHITFGFLSLARSFSLFVRLQSQHVVSNDRPWRGSCLHYGCSFFFVFFDSRFVVVFCVRFHFILVCLLFSIFFALLLLLNAKMHLSRAECVSRSYFILSDWMSLKCIKSAHRVCLNAEDPEFLTMCALMHTGILSQYAFDEWSSLSLIHGVPLSNRDTFIVSFFLSLSFSNYFSHRVWSTTLSIEMFVSKISIFFLRFVHVPSIALRWIEFDRFMSRSKIASNHLFSSISLCVCSFSRSLSLSQHSSICHR